jgi:hypothetical protein
MLYYWPGIANCRINTLSPYPATQMYTELRRNNWLALANSPVFYGKLTDETMKTMLGYTIENGGGSFPTSVYAAETIYQIVAVPAGPAPLDPFAQIF